LIRRPSVFLVVSVHHPAIPGGAILLGIPSFPLYAAARLASAFISLIPESTFRKRIPPRCPVNPRKVCRELTKCAAAMLCSGSYTLLDIQVPSERLRLRVRLI